ncbi:MAG: DUF4397 domain-containing protein [Anaerolineae bacterium]
MFGLILVVMLFALPSFGLAQAQSQHGFLRVIHNAPTTPPVTITVEGQGVIYNLKYGEQSPYIKVGAGYGFFRIDILPASVQWDGATGNTPSLTTIDMAFAPNQARTLWLIESAGQITTEVVGDPVGGALPNTGVKTHVQLWLLGTSIATLAGGIQLRRRAIKN